MRPPRLATALVRFLVRRDLQESFLGDLEERWHRQSAAASRRAARRSYWRESIGGAVALSRFLTSGRLVRQYRFTEGMESQ